MQNVRDDEQLLARLLNTIGQSLVRFKSIELHLVGQRAGRKSIFKHELSLDGEVSFVHEPSSGFLPMEVFSPVPELTTLANAGHGLILPRDEPTILDQLAQVRREAIQARASGDGRRVWVIWYGWGLTRAAYVNRAGELEEGWFLRERLGSEDHLVPLLRVSAYFEAEPGEGFMLVMSSSSHIYSLFEPVFDASRGEWVAKEDARAPHRNAQLLAEGVADFLAGLPGAHFTWEVDREHQPDLRGTIPTEFVNRFGGPGERRKLPS